ncbi:unnamed protein product, partial [Rotaria sordida]
MEATTSGISFDARYLPIIEQVGEGSAEFL